MTLSDAKAAPMTGGQWSLLVLLSILWGGSFFFYKILVAVLPVFTVVAARAILAAVALVMFAIITKQSLAPLKRWRAFALLGLVGNTMPFALIAFAETRIPSGLAAILNATQPLMTAVVAHVFSTHEKMTRLRIMGIVLGLMGVVVLIGPDVLSGGHHDLIGEAASLGGALCYAFGGVFARRFKEPPYMVATGQLIASSFFLGIASLIADRPWTLANPDAAAWGALLALSLASTAFAFVAYFWLLPRVGATNVSLVTFLVPVSALLLGWAFLSEHLSASALTGMAIIGAGLLFIDERLLRIWRK